MTRPKVDYGYIISDSLEAFHKRQWWWINSNHPLGDFPFDASSVIGLFSLDWWRSIPKAVVAAASTKSGWLRKLSSLKWVERDREASEAERAWATSRPQSRHVIYAPPRLFIYKSEFVRIVCCGAE